MELFATAAIGGLCLVGALGIILNTLPSIIETFQRKREIKKKEESGK
jgi:hypothetical protein